jgi:cyclic-di-GMP-binding protein
VRNLYYLVSPERQNNPRRADEFRIQPLREWISGLPAANVGMMIRKFHDRIVEMNATEIDAVVLFEALEELYPVYLTAEEYLVARLIGKSYPLASDEQKIGQLAEAVTRDFLIGYGVIIRDMAAPGAGRRIARACPTVICRLIGGLSRILLLRYLLRLPDPQWLWLDLHGLYVLAEQNEKLDTKIKEHAEGRTVTAATLYKKITLLRLADPWALGHREILDIFQALEDWSESVALTAGNAPGCVLYMDEDKPPVLEVGASPEKDPDSRIYRMRLEHLFGKLSELIAGADPSVGRFDLVTADCQRAVGFPAALLGYLRDRWSGGNLPKTNLFEDRSPRIMSIGLKATHQQLNPPADRKEKILHDWLVTINEDQSLRCEFNQPGQIFLGSLVSLKLADLEHARRVLGVVNRIWMNRLDGAVNFQIAELCPQVLPAGIQPVRENKDIQVYQRALLYISAKGSVRKANLVLESQKLKNGNTVQLLTHETSLKVRLENRSNVAPGYWCFECVPLAEDKKEPIPVKGYDFL